MVPRVPPRHPASARYDRITRATTALTSFEMAEVDQRERLEEFAPAVRAAGRWSVENAALTSGVVARNVRRNAARPTQEILSIKGGTV